MHSWIGGDSAVLRTCVLCAAALATHDSWDTFLVGSAASVGAGISMGFAQVGLGGALVFLTGILIRSS